MGRTLSRLDILAAEGDGQHVLEEFARLRQKGEPIPDELLDYIVVRFQRYLGGEDLDTAFDLKRKRGRPPTTGQEADAQTAMVIRVLELLESGACGSEAEAKEVVAEETELDLRTVELYLKRDRSLARYLLDIKKFRDGLISKARSRK